MIDLIKSYIDNRVELFKLSMISVTANIAAKLMSSFLILLFFLMIMLMFSIALSLFIGEFVGHMALGFLITGSAYLFVFLLYVIFAKKKTERILKDKIVQVSLDAEKEVMQEMKN